VFNAYRVNLDVAMNDITEVIFETMKENMLQFFNQLRENDSIYESNFSLGSYIPDISLKDNFEYIISPNMDAPIDTAMINLRKKINLFIS